MIYFEEMITINFQSVINEAQKHIDEVYSGDQSTF